MSLNSSLAALFYWALSILSVMTEADADDAVTSGAVAAWADEYFEQALEDNRFTSAGVVVVKNGEIIFSKGYGPANILEERSVDPETTRFRIGSVGKTMTATAVMTLVESGRIASLDDSANAYLKRVQIPGEDGASVTVRDLLTHSAGLEDRWRYMFSPFTGEPSAKDYSANIPKIVRTPGERAVYSNHGFGLAGMLVEDASGQSFADYVKVNVFSPLGMSHSMVYDGPPAAGDDEALLYERGADGNWTPVLERLSYANDMLLGAGLYAISLNDMGRYMISHLEAGRNGTGLLSQEGFAKMHGPQIRNAPNAVPLGLSFMLIPTNGYKTLTHGGGTPDGATTRLVMIPELDLGLFVAKSGKTPGIDLFDAVGGLLGDAPKQERLLSVGGVQRDFFKTFIPSREICEGAIGEASDEKDLGPYIGGYVDDRRSYTTASLFLSTLQSPIVKVEPDGVGGLSVFGDPGYRATKKDVFAKCAEGRTDRVYFTRASDGALTGLAFDNPASHMSKLSYWERPQSYLSYYCAGLAFSVAGLLLAPFWRPANGAARAMKWTLVACLALQIAAPLFVTAGFEPGGGVFAFATSDNLTRWIVFLGAFNSSLIGLAALIATAPYALKAKLFPGRFAFLPTRYVYTAFLIAGPLMLIAGVGLNLIGFQAP